MAQRRMAAALSAAAWAMAAVLAAVLFAAGFFMSVTLIMPEIARYHVSAKPGVALAAVAMALALLLMNRLCLRLSGRHMAALPAAVIGAAAALVLLGFRMEQIADFKEVCESAQAFAAGDYRRLSGDYFNACTYQLGVTFFLEGVTRLLRLVGAQAYLGQAMQVANVIMGLGVLWALADMARRTLPDGERVGAAIWAVGALFFPLWMYAMFVYGTMPMLLLCALSMRAFALHVEHGRARDGAAFALFAALAYVVKPNAAILLAALIVCAALHGLSTRRWRALGFAMAGAALAVLLMRAVVWQYELRGGVHMREGISVLARLAMGMQDGEVGAGWYNKYIEQFFPLGERYARQNEIAWADLTASLRGFAEDPAMAVRFFAEKFFTQWLEATHGTMIYAMACTKTGVLARYSKFLIGEYGPVRTLAETILAGEQRVLMLLAAIACAWHARRSRGAGTLILPVTILGGTLYHMIFEAKSQYTFVYMVYMLPLAAQGLCLLAARFRRRGRAAR